MKERGNLGCFGFGKEEITVTVEKILLLVDSTVENEICEETKLGWLCSVEGMVLSEIHKKRPEEIVLPRRGDDSLILPDAYASVYLHYLLAMVELTKGNYEGFTKMNAEFEKAFSTYGRYYIRNRG
jgi:hypothetical protein